jgi:hypothetical protein
MRDLTEGQFAFLVRGQPNYTPEEIRYGATFLWGLAGFATVFAFHRAGMAGWFDLLFVFDLAFLGEALVIILFLEIVAGVNFVAALLAPVGNTFISIACVMPLLLWSLVSQQPAEFALTLGICLFYIAAGVAAGYGGARLRKLRERRHARLQGDGPAEEGGER